MPAINDKLYRLVTEAQNVKWLKDEIAARFGGATIFLADGIWQGGRETALIIEIVSTRADFVREFARDICRYNEQESVLIQEIPCLYQFVSIEKKQDGGDTMYGI